LKIRDHHVFCIIPRIKIEQTAGKTIVCGAEQIPQTNARFLTKRKYLYLTHEHNVFACCDLHFGSRLPTPGFFKTTCSQPFNIFHRKCNRLYSDISDIIQNGYMLMQLNNMYWDFKNQINIFVCITNYSQNDMFVVWNAQSIVKNNLTSISELCGNG